MVSPQMGIIQEMEAKTLMLSKAWYSPKRTVVNHLKQYSADQML